MFTMKRKPLSRPSPAEALPGRATAIPTASTHFVNGAPLKGPYSEGSEVAGVGLGWFWGGGCGIRARLLLGCREGFLEHSRRDRDRRRLCRRTHAQSDL